MSESMGPTVLNVERAATDRLRVAVERQSEAMGNLGRALVQRFVADEHFAILAANEARDILPCTLARRLERFARGDHWPGLAVKVAADRRLLKLLSRSRAFREAAIGDPPLAARIAECSSARAVANEAGKQFRLAKRAPQAITRCAMCPELARQAVRGGAGV